MAGLLQSSQTTWMTALVKKSLDKSLPQYRKSSTKTDDGAGHDTTPMVSFGTLDCNVKSPTAGQLELYAGIIGSQKSVVLRVMDDSDVQQGDEIDYDGLRWTLHAVENADSYTFTKEWLAVVVS